MSRANPRIRVNTGLLSEILASGLNHRQMAVAVDDPEHPVLYVGDAEGVPKKVSGIPDWLTAADEDSAETDSWNEEMAGTLADFTSRWTADNLGSAAVAMTGGTLSINVGGLGKTSELIGYTKAITGSTWRVEAAVELTFPASYYEAPYFGALLGVKSLDTGRVRSLGVVSTDYAALIAAKKHTSTTTQYATQDLFTLAKRRVILAVDRTGTTTRWSIWNGDACTWDVIGTYDDSELTGSLAIGLYGIGTTSTAPRPTARFAWVRKRAYQDASTWPTRPGVA